MSLNAVGTVLRGRDVRQAQRAIRDTNMLPALKRKLPVTEI